MSSTRLLRFVKGLTPEVIVIALLLPLTVIDGIIQRSDVPAALDILLPSFCMAAIYLAGRLHSGQLVRALVFAMIGGTVAIANTWLMGMYSPRWHSLYWVLPPVLGICGLAVLELRESRHFAPRSVATIMIC